MRTFSSIITIWLYLYENSILTVDAANTFTVKQGFCKVSGGTSKFTSPSDNIESCQNKCDGKDDCDAFWYNSITKACKLNLNTDSVEITTANGPEGSEKYCGIKEKTTFKTPFTVKQGFCNVSGGTSKFGSPSDNIESCQNTCDGRDDCDAFWYNSITKACKLNLNTNSVEFESAKGSKGSVKYCGIKERTPFTVKQGFCNVSGGTSNFSYNILNIQSCRNNCDGRDDCDAFWYNSNTNACKLNLNTDSVEIMTANGSEGSGKYCGVKEKKSPPPSSSKYFDVEEGSCLFSKKGFKRVAINKSAEECSSLCQSQDTCNGFFWYETDKMRCETYYESIITSFSAKEGRYCGIKKTASSTAPTSAPKDLVKKLYLMPGYACAGKVGATKQSVQDVWSCRNQCLKNDSCVGANYLDNNQKICMMYYTKPAMVATSEKISYCGLVKIVERTPTQSPTTQLPTHSQAPSSTPTVRITTTVNTQNNFKYIFNSKCGEIDKENSTRINNVTTFEQCILKCDTTPQCKSFFYNQYVNVCNLLFYKVKNITKVQYPGPKLVVCGKIDNDGTGTGIEPTASPVSGVSTKNQFKYVYHSNCGEVDEVNSTKIDSFTSFEKCIKKCDNTEDCKAFFWDEYQNSCYILYYKVKNITKVDPGAKLQVCGKRESKVTSPPNTAPITAPSVVDNSINTKRQFKYILDSTCGDIDNSQSTLIKTFTTFKQCIMKCDKTQECKAFYWNESKNFCYLLSYKIKNITKVDPADKLQVCGKVNNVVTLSPTPPPVPTISPTASIVTKNKFIYKYNTKCDEDVNWDEAEAINDVLSFKACLLKCDSSLTCRSFSFNEKKARCILMKYAVKNIVNVDPSDKVMVCGKLDFKTANPTPSPTKLCTLEAQLGHNFADPDKAPYYGYHSDWLQVTKNSPDDFKICSFSKFDKDELPPWCDYQISAVFGDPAWADSATLINWDDDYYPEGDFLSKEKAVIKGAAGATIYILVQHYFYDEDYYADDDSWNKDHMIPALLTVVNMSHKSQTALHTGQGWSHPAQKNTPTHIKNKDGTYSPNPNYQGNFCVTISCNSNCLCTANYSIENSC